MLMFAMMLLLFNNCKPEIFLINLIFFFFENSRHFHSLEKEMSNSRAFQEFNDAWEPCEQIILFLPTYPTKKYRVGIQQINIFLRMAKLKSCQTCQSLAWFVWQILCLTTYCLIINTGKIQIFFLFCSMKQRK